MEAAKKDVAAVTLIRAKGMQKTQLEDALAILKQSLPELSNQIDAADGAGDGKLRAKLMADFEKGLDEMNALRTKIAAVDQEITVLQDAENAEGRSEALRQARRGDEMERQGHDMMLRAQAVKAAALELFAKHNPMKRVQTSSKQFLKFQRVVHDRKLMGFKIKAKGLLQPGEKDEPLFEEITRREETTIMALPLQIAGMQEGGWTLCPNQELKEEPLDLTNSREEPSHPTPDVFYARFNV